MTAEYSEFMIAFIGLCCRVGEQATRSSRWDLHYGLATGEMLFDCTVLLRLDCMFCAVEYVMNKLNEMIEIISFSKNAAKTRLERPAEGYSK